jgi:GNAT superfamily N-acetyltransferase
LWPGAVHFQLNHKKLKARYTVEELQQVLEEACGFDLMQCPDGDGEFTYLSDLFQLDIAITDRILVVKAIEVYEKRAGIGRTLIGAIHEFCRRWHLEPVAQKVEKTDEAEGFWEAMGYAPDGTGNFTRIESYLEVA